MRMGYLLSSRGAGAVVALLVIISVLVTPGCAFDLTEILYVKGCKDSTPPRATSACFSGSSPKQVVTLSLRGLQFPATPAGQTTASHLRVELVESLAISALEGSSSERASAPMRLTCGNARLSEVFPTQLITCELDNPIPASTAGDDDDDKGGRARRQGALEAWKKVGGTLWFDVVLQATAAGSAGEGSTYRDVAILRQAVEVDVTATLRRAGVVDAGAPVSPTVDPSQHPLERLYATKHQGTGSAAVDGSDAEAEMTDEEALWVELGIGGLKEELRALFRRVFLSRLPSLASLTQALDMQHVRGVILYGPPGNGKSLIARSLFRLLGPDTRLTVVNAADILSKYVGESEKNLRDIFGGVPVGTSAQAETARKDGLHIDDDDDEDYDHDVFGVNRASHADGGATRPALHVLVIDEFESLFRRRGHSEDESSAKAAYDGVTNTLLSLMDGIETRNDLLVIGLTNRLQSIDSAMLRPGRFEVLIEVPPPDLSAREEIFFIHSAKLREGGFLDPNVTLHDLAVRSGGFSGSDIAGTVRSAVSYALLRYRQGEPMEAPAAEDGAPSAMCGGSGAAPMATDDGETTLPSCGPGVEGTSTDAFTVTMKDLERAMADIRSAKDEASSLSHLSNDGRDRGDVAHYDEGMSEKMAQAKRLVTLVRKSNHIVSGAIAVSGGAGTGTSFVAQQLATLFPFATVRYLSCRRLVELRDRDELLGQIRDALGEASRVETGMVVLDDFDLLQDSLSGFPVLEGTLRNMLYEYRHSVRGVSRSLQGTRDSAKEASESGGGSITVNAGSTMHAQRNRRFLVVTGKRRDALSLVEPDLAIRTRPVRRTDIPKLFEHYRVMRDLQKKLFYILLSYPASLSYRNFLRVTDMALWRVAMAREAAAAATPVDQRPPAPAMPRFFAGTSRGALSAAQDRIGNDDAVVFIESVEDMSTFSKAVKEVCVSLGLSSSFTGWYDRGERKELTLHAADEEAKGDNDGESEKQAAELEKAVAEGDEAADEGVELAW